MPTDPPPSDRNRWAALYVLCAGMLMIVLDATIVNVALPSIQDDLGFSASSLAWVVNAYLIAFGGLLLLAGRAGDLIGQRRLFLIGLTIFTRASALCAVAQTQELLIAARFIQGVGGALTSAVILGMIVTMFPQPGEQGRAIGVFSFLPSAGASTGHPRADVPGAALVTGALMLGVYAIVDARSLLLALVAVALLAAFIWRQATAAHP